MINIVEKFRAFLEKNNLRFEKQDNSFFLRWTDGQNEDLDSTCMISFDLDEQLVMVNFSFAFKIDDSYMIETAFAVCMVNNWLYSGNFGIDFSDNSVTFRNCYRYKEPTNTDFFDTIIYDGLNTYEKFLPKLKEVSHGQCGIKEFDNFLDAPGDD